MTHWDALSFDAEFAKSTSKWEADTGAREEARYLKVGDDLHERGAALEALDCLAVLQENKQLLRALKEVEESQPDDIDLIWRLARAFAQLADDTGEADPEQCQGYLQSGEEYAKRALVADPNHFGGHKYMSIMLGQGSKFKQTKDKIRDSFMIREHGEKACELAPKDPSIFMLLGHWCLAVASVSAMERRGAAMLFGTLPVATFDEALGECVCSAASARPVLPLVGCFVLSSLRPPPSAALAQPLTTARRPGATIPRRILCACSCAVRGKQAPRLPVVHDVHRRVLPQKEAGRRRAALVQQSAGAGGDHSDGPARARESPGGAGRDVI